VGDIRASMLEEVDFRKEAQHLAEFEGYLERARLRGVATCPGVYRQFSTQRCAGREGPVQHVCGWGH
jgi:aarF domain-containing kinase